MTIPADEVLKADLLAFLAAEPDARSTVWRVSTFQPAGTPGGTAEQFAALIKKGMELWRG